MEKIGMRHEGLLRQHVYKNGRFEDLATCAILRSEFEQQA
jgi:RimJ/RimL family protein N-acetyltransferase